MRNEIHAKKHSFGGKIERRAKVHKGWVRRMVYRCSTVFTLCLGTVSRSLKFTHNFKWTSFRIHFIFSQTQIWLMLVQCYYQSSVNFFWYATIHFSIVIFMNIVWSCCSLMFAFLFVHFCTDRYGVWIVRFSQKNAFWLR